MPGRGLAVCIFSSFTAVLVFLLLSAMYCSGHHCGKFEYWAHNKCCKECSPENVYWKYALRLKRTGHAKSHSRIMDGEEMKSRCSSTSDTLCVPCQDGYYNSQNNYYSCTICTTCNAAKGRKEVKKCNKISDTVCTCMKGYTPYDSRSSEESPSEKECFPCPDGHFSSGGNDRCRPWTNCLADGKKTLRPGTKTEDAICDDQEKQATTLQTSTLYISVTNHRNNGSAATPTPFIPKGSLSTTRFRQDDPAEPNLGSLSLILICLTLLMVSGMAILLLTIQATKKEKTKRPLVNGQQDGWSFRIPIQEEQIDSNSSLIKN